MLRGLRFQDICILNFDIFDGHFVTFHPSPHLNVNNVILSVCAGGKAIYSGTLVYIDHNKRYVTDIPKMFCLLTTVYNIE